MQFDYKDQVVLITGAAGGFGRLAAAEFARAGAKLVLCDLDAKKLEELKSSLHGADVLIEAGDVSEDATHRHLVAHATDAYGRLDVAINNAGVAHAFTKITETDDTVMQQMLAVNVFGVFLAMKHQLPIMERQNSVVILTCRPLPVSSARRCSRPTPPPSTESSGSPKAPPANMR